LRKVSYKKLWKLLIDMDINKQTLAQLSGISPATLSKMVKGDYVNLEILVKICSALNCDTSDIMEFERNAFNDVPRIGAEVKT